MPDEPQPTIPPAHPDFAKPPAAAGENRGPAIWMSPDEWAAHQQEVKTLKEWKQQNDQILEMKENERLRALAEKGQVEQAFNEVKTANEKRMAELNTRLEQRERAWLDERRTQTINEAMAGLIFVGKDDEARSRTAAMVRRLLELDIEAVIGPTGAPNVRDRKTLQPASDYLKMRLTAPDSEFAALLAPRAPGGGSGTDGTRTLAITPSNDPTGDYMKSIREMRERLVNAKTAPFQG